MSARFQKPPALEPQASRHVVLGLGHAKEMDICPSFPTGDFADCSGDANSAAPPSGTRFEIWSRESHRFCTECEDTRATVLCLGCDEEYCALCWASLHRRGLRAEHSTKSLACAEDQAPPPEATEESSWFAGVWPSPRPPTTEATKENGAGNGTSNGSGAAPDTPAALQKVQKGVSHKSNGAAGVALTGCIQGSSKITGKRRAPDGDSSSRDGLPQQSSGNLTLDSTAEGIACTDSGSSPQVRKECGGDPATSSTSKERPSAGNEVKLRSDGNGQATADANAQGHGIKGAAAASPAFGLRPSGYEGPLCPSGIFFSKPQTPSTSPYAKSARKDTSSPPKAKRPRSTPPMEAQNGDPRNATLRFEEQGKTAGGGDSSSARQPSAPSPAMSTPPHSAKCNGVAGSNGGKMPPGSEHAPTGSPNTLASRNGHRRDGNTPPKTDKHSRPSSARNGEARPPNGNTDADASPTGAMKSDSSLPQNGSSRGSSATPSGDENGLNACKGNGSKAEIQLPKSMGNVIGNHGKAETESVLEPVRVPTAEEKQGLADLARRSANVPLRLDESERSVLDVLQASLNHVQYTDGTECVVRGSRLPLVMRHLKGFFGSLWGTFRASGVTPPKSTPPAVAGKNSNFKTHFHHKLNNSSSQSKSWSAGHRPLSNGRSKNGVLGESSTGTEGAAGAKKGDGKGGLAAFGQDCFKIFSNSCSVTREWACVIRKACEVGRRHKILNPEKIRGTHGMLMYILMDAEHPHVRAQTGFSCVRPMRTVGGLTTASELQLIFSDPDVLVATQPVLPWAKGHCRLEKSDGNTLRVEQDKTAKAEARKRLTRRHRDKGSGSELPLILDSLADSVVYREMSTRPIRRMISFLKANWRPDRLDDSSRRNVSLAITAGEGGARLTHNHSTQFYFVLQSLMLWLEVVDNMYCLWAAGERDMLNTENQYNLRNTGQGLQRVQTAYNVGQRMQQFQRGVVKSSGRSWVGSAAVHLGDNCVPNALVFLDKYSQVPWILNPILQVMDYLTDLDDGANPEVMAYVKKRWHSTDFAKRCILRNFFRFGFDGSGGDNDYDAGSCVDGRLTSAWNWCSKLERKSFHPIFMTSGFSGFDGDYSS